MALLWTLFLSFYPQWLLLTWSLWLTCAPYFPQPLWYLENSEQRNGTQGPAPELSFWPSLGTAPAPDWHVISTCLKSIKPPYLGSGALLLWPCSLRPVNPPRSRFVTSKPAVSLAIWYDPAYCLSGETCFLGILIFWEKKAYQLSLLSLILATLLKDAPFQVLKEDFLSL